MQAELLKLHLAPVSPTGEGWFITVTRRVSKGEIKRVFHTLWMAR